MRPLTQWLLLCERRLSDTEGLTIMIQWTDPRTEVMVAAFVVAVLATQILAALFGRPLIPRSFPRDLYLYSLRTPYRWLRSFRLRRLLSAGWEDGLRDWVEKDLLAQFFQMDGCDELIFDMTASHLRVEMGSTDGDRSHAWISDFQPKDQYEAVKDGCLGLAVTGVVSRVLDLEGEQVVALQYEVLNSIVSIKLPHLQSIYRRDRNIQRRKVAFRQSERAWGVMRGFLEDRPDIRLRLADPNPDQQAALEFSVFWAIACGSQIKVTI